MNKTELKELKELHGEEVVNIAMQIVMKDPNIEYGYKDTIEEKVKERPKSKAVANKKDINPIAH